MINPNLFVIFCFAFTLLLTSCEKEFEAQKDNILINRFNPPAALPGDTIAIVGQGFNVDAVKNVVQFSASSTTAKVLEVDEEGSRLIVVVPKDAREGKVKIASGIYSTLSNLPFLLSPSIGSINPNGALPGEQISVSGKNFTTDLSRLLLYVGQIEVNSIFGGSSTEIIFPLPEGLPVGNTTIRVGTRLTETENVVSPPFPFTVFDPEQPSLSSIEPSAGTPGQQITLTGNAFKEDPGKTFVLFGTEELSFADFVSISSDEIILTVPEGLSPGVVTVSVKVVTDDDVSLLSDGVSFEVLEQADVEFFFTAINGPGTVGAAVQDDSLYRAQISSSGGANISRLPVNKIGQGIIIGNDNVSIYYSINAIRKIGIDGLNDVGISSEISTTDLALNESESEIYYYSFDDGGVFKYILSTNSKDKIFNSSTQIHNLKFDDGALYLNMGGTMIFNLDPDTESFNLLHTGNSGVFITGLCIGLSKIYFSEGPNTLISLQANDPGGSSIYAINKDGSGTPELLFEMDDAAIMDLEISSDGSTLFWMVGHDDPSQGGIMQGTLGVGAIDDAELIIPGIRNGRYFDVLEH